MYQYVVGGLGNQLFQLSMLHYLLSEASEAKGTIWIDENPRHDRPFLLRELVKNCSHVKKISHPYAGLRGWITRLVNQLPRMSVIEKYRIVEKREEVEYSCIYDSKLLLVKYRFWIGYFQHYKLVEKSWPVFGPELTDFLEKVSIEISLPEIFTLIHIRGGDFYELKGSNGVLAKDYYQRALSLIEGSLRGAVIVLTDDVQNAVEICSDLGPSRILGPESIGEWESLKIMSMATSVITANSTFSWWGGRLALEKGAKVIIPTPWFKDHVIGVNDAFEHPQFQKVPSAFQA